MSKLLLVLLLSVSVLCTEGFAQWDHIHDLQEAGHLSRLEFRNAEFTVKFWSLVTPIDANLAEHAIEIKTSIHGLLDYENERCLWLQRKEIVTTSDSVDPELSYVIVRDDRASASPSDYSPQLDIPIDDFFAFTSGNGVWRMEYAGTGLDGIVSKFSPKDLCDDKIKTMKMIRDRAPDPNRIQTVKRYGHTAPDGSRIFIIENFTNKTTSTTKYDAKYVFPISHTRVREVGGDKELDTKTEANFELIGGFTRGRFISIDGPDFIFSDVLGNIRCKSVKTFEYKWLQFNEAQLEWPDEKKIMSNSKSMLRFITPEDGESG